MYIEIEPIISIIAGIVILVFPKIINYTIGIYLLIIGILVMKNMGANSTGGVTQTEARKAIERAEDTKNHVKQKVKNIQNRLQNSD